MTKKVLDVGQCNADHNQITQLLSREFDVEIQRAHSFDEATQMALDTPFDLILINRILDAGGTAGMSILNAIKTQPSTAETPVMIVSNYADAQADAVSAGGMAGFGKLELDLEKTRDLLSQVL
ncbi:MAG: CheY-like chemotaxis protein [Mariniblastus sp.]